MKNPFLAPLETLPGIGPSLSLKFERLGLKTLEDCLFHLPHRYQDRTSVCPINRIQPGDSVVVMGTIVKNEIVQGKRRMLRIHVEDGTGGIFLRFFHFNLKQKEQLKVGSKIRCFGEARAVGYALEIVHPEYTLGDTLQVEALPTQMTPIYPLTEGLTQTALRKWIAKILEKIHEWHLPDLLPQAMTEKLKLPTLKEAIEFCHTPPVQASFEMLENYQYPAQKRLVFEELLAHQISLLKFRSEQQLRLAPVCHEKKWQATLIEQLPFALTDSQTQVIKEISYDLQQETPMMRLVQGDVGSGKTVVALSAMLQAVSSGYQAILMAPTEILAQQHADYIAETVSSWEIKTCFLSGKLSAKEKKLAYEDIRMGNAKMIIGTHALIQEAVEFHKPGIVIFDEQHRFGVGQRLSLLKKSEFDGRMPHQLMLTATPIPRTLAMTAFSDLDISVMNELPKGRQPITTISVGKNRRDEVVERVYSACKKGEQAYWVCTLIEESETLQAQAALELCKVLSEKMHDVRVGLVHGRLSAIEKDEIMQSFIQGEIQLLIATTVIEVGVNVPNASLMIIENPERLGLSQLHQLRGRVGRGEKQSYCVLLYNEPLSYTAKMRLKVIKDTQDGFIIAEKDLELRGPGEWMGTRQTGEQHYKIAQLARDREWAPLLKECAEEMIDATPDQADALVERWMGVKREYALS